ncbi:MAG: sigma-E factor negative regulatory protein [Betaproteobacteria bacterium]|jgi:sigma-E factor negative regulatory protein RseA|nr:sigma-E factor negative regulatory protein [Betaproteobacteria bacterium]
MKEHLSALMDDQGDRAECDHCLDRLKEDVELRDSWALYHLIGDVLRGTNGAALPESFADRLAAEPTVLAPRTRPANSAPNSLLRYALPIAASIAAVAFVAWVGLPQIQPSPVLQARTSAPVTVSTAPVVPVAHDVGDYLLAHQRFSPSSAMSGVAPYVRTVSEPGPAR